MNQTPQSLLSDNIQLVSLPEVCMQVQVMAEDPNCGADDLGRLIAKDTALTSRLLKLVNSAFYGFSSRVETVSRAVSLVGIAELRNITLAASAAEVFADIPGDLMDMVSFWRHSVFTGLVARKLAAECHVLHHERLFTAGLLHDVGRLLIFMRLPEQASEILASGREDHGDLCELERAILGFDHAEAGAELLHHWKLPPALCSAIRHHHAPRQASEAPLEAAILHLANAITHYLELSDTQHPSPYYDPYGALLNPRRALEEGLVVAAIPADPEIWQHKGLAKADLEGIIIESAHDFDEVLDLFYPLPSRSMT
ncbi:MAG: HDOD domain-containing protein [Xanthomonadaceae bacterium]|nr:HDOD domain-containing protein [Xanthomonadaceae bacterium]